MPQPSGLTCYRSWGGLPSSPKPLPSLSVYLRRQGIRHNVSARRSKLDCLSRTQPFPQALNSGCRYLNRPLPRWMCLTIPDLVMPNPSGLLALIGDAPHAWTMVNALRARFSNFPVVVERGEPASLFWARRKKKLGAAAVLSQKAVMGMAKATKPLSL